MRATITEKKTTYEAAHNTPTRALAGVPNIALHCSLLLLLLLC